MTQKIITGFVALSLATMISTAAFAGSHQQKADTNQDGEVSLAEFNTQRNARFAAIDTNADGRLSMDERKTHKQAKKQERADKKFSRLDANADGVISRAEFDAGADKRTSKHAKMKKHRKQMRKKMRKKMGQDGKKADTNQDGFIDRAEFDAQAQKIFAHRDADQDGVLSKADRGFRKQNRSGHN